MKRSKIAALALCTGLIAGAAPLQPEGVDMEAWMKASTPGQQHAELAHQIGEWDIKVRIWMDPAAPPMESTGTATISWLMEGIWLQEHSSYDFMGQPQSGFGIHGYDNYKQQFVTCWVSSGSTAMSTMSGSMSPDGKFLTMFGTMDEPMTGEKGKTVKYQVVVEDDDHFTFKVQEVQYGEPFTVVEIDYARKM